MEQSFSLKDKVIVVTGGTGILGNAFVNAIVEAGAAVGILGRNAEIANERADTINKNGGRAIALIADALDEEQLIAARTKILAAFGKIDGLVNAAGGNMPDGVLQPEESIFKMKMDGMKKVLDLNLWGTLIPTQVFGEAIAETGSGSIVNISSMNSKKSGNQSTGL
jgi:NAD(P)-dependent dehydrogenase (short-subunit alcohol dehydrogenase family)